MFTTYNLFAAAFPAPPPCSGTQALSAVCGPYPPCSGLAITKASSALVRTGLAGSLRRTLRRALTLGLCCALALSLSFSLTGCGLKNMGSAPPPSPKASQVLKTAYSQMGKRYRSGGDSPRKGFDCSGLIYWVYQKHGIKMPRITTDQAQAGYSVPKWQAAPGDIVVFRTSSAPRGLHTGIYAGNNTFIHSPKRGENVRMESMEIPYWKSKLSSVRRVIQ